MAANLVPASLTDADPAWAWAPYEPSPQNRWNLEKAAHLFRRGGFGADWATLQRAVNEGPQQSLARLLAGDDGQDAFYEQAGDMAVPLLGTNDAGNLPPWWLHVMTRTPHPLREKMTLFWHGHFATSAAKVTDARLMYDQNALLRQHALGKFGPLITAVSKDPAMLIWLDSTTNKKLRPNENFAREVMELFCLGIGAYTEQDIKEAARAFTGWEVRHGRFVFNAYEHDRGAKTVLGQTGAFDGDDLIGVLLDQPACSHFIARKLFRYLVSETQTPPAQLLEPLARGYREHGYETAWLVRTVLASNLFYSPLAVRQKIKAPVEFAVSLIRSLEGATNTYALAEDLQPLGQAVFYPPNVKGWDGGTEWINSSTLLSRVNLVWALVSGRDPRYGDKIDLAGLTQRHAAGGAAEKTKWLVDLLLAADMPREVIVQLTALAGRDANDRTALARVVQGVAALPEFHLA